jgi:hypothetical protein
MIGDGYILISMVSESRGIDNKNSPMEEDRLFPIADCRMNPS